MEKKELTVEGPITVGSAKVYVAVETRIACDGSEDGLVCSGVRMPTHIVVVSDSEKRAFTAGGEEITLERLIEDVPGIEELLAANNA